MYWSRKWHELESQGETSDYRYQRELSTSLPAVYHILNWSFPAHSGLGYALEWNSQIFRKTGENNSWMSTNQKMPALNIALIKSYPSGPSPCFQARISRLKVRALLNILWYWKVYCFRAVEGPEVQVTQVHAMKSLKINFRESTSLTQESNENPNSIVHSSWIQSFFSRKCPRGMHFQSHQ